MKWNDKNIMKASGIDFSYIGDHNFCRNPRPEDYQSVGDHNFCRNPNNADLPWCFTDDNMYQYCCPPGQSVKNDFGKFMCVAKGPNGEDLTPSQQKTIKDFSTLSIKDFDKK